MDWRKTLLEFYRETFHLHHWVMTSNSIDLWEKLEESQWLSRKQILDIQHDKLQKLIWHAYEHVPYYRKSFDAVGVRPQDIRDINDLVKIPFLTKETLKKSDTSFFLSDNHNPNNVVRIATSGSTGVPLHVYADRTQLEYRYAAVLRNWHWTGYKFGDKQIRLWHQTIGMTEEQIKMEWLDSFLMRREFLPVFEMDRNRLFQFMEKIRKYGPTMMDGYAEAFNLLSRFIKSNNISDIEVPIIISSAQMLPDHVRELIREQFHAEVFDRYGAREFSTIAHECEYHNGYHVNAENLIVEILKDEKPVRPKEMGEVVITDLNNFSMPLIRYRIGDLSCVLEGECRCGRGLPRIGKIMGRTQGVIVGTNKKFMVGSFFLHLLKDYENEIERFQIVQRKYGEIIFKLIPGRKYNNNIVHLIENQFRDWLGEDMEITTVIVDQIPMVKTGKYTVCISELPIDFQKNRNYEE